MAGGLEGICNGIDTQEWSPFCDKYLDVKYDAESMEEGKAIAKETLQAELGLDVRKRGAHARHPSHYHWLFTLPCFSHGL